MQDIDFQEAAQTLERMAAQQQHIAAVAAIVRQIGSLDGAANELQKKVDALTDEKAQLEAIVTDAQATVLLAKKQASDVLDQAEQAAKELAADAEAKHANAMAQAARDAGDLVAQAHIEADRVKEEAEAAVAAAQEKLEQIGAATAAAHAAQAAAEEQAAAAQKKLDAIRASASQIAGV